MNPIKSYLLNQPPLNFSAKLIHCNKPSIYRGRSWKLLAVIKDVPANSHLKFDALISWNTYDFYDGWDNLNAYTYVALEPEHAMKMIFISKNYGAVPGSSGRDRRQSRICTWRQNKN